MRTTITIDEGLLSELKRRAAEMESTVSRLIENCLRLTIYRQARESEDDGTFELLTDGRGGRFSSYNLDRTSALLEIDDPGSFREGGAVSDAATRRQRVDFRSP